MTSEKVIRSYLMIAGLYTLSASLIWGVNTLFLLDAGLNVFEVFIANSIFTAAMAFFEIPTGVLADTRGRRISFLYSVLVLALGTLGYVTVAWLDGGFLWFCLMSVILGLGYTFYSGAVEAWLVDALKATKYPGKLDQVFARGGLVTGGAMLIGTISGGLLGGFSLAAPFLLRSGLLVLLFIVAYTMMHDIGYQPRALKLSLIPKEISRMTKDSLTYGWKNRDLRLIILVGFIQGSFISWAWYAWQPYFLDLLGQEAVWVAGLVAALISLAMMGGNTIVEYLTRFCGRRTTLLLWAAGVFSLAMVGVGLTSSFWVAVVLILVAMVANGVNQPVRQAFMHRLIPSEQRATIISFDSMVASGGGILGQSGLGYLAQVRSYGSGYFFGGAITGLVFPVWFLLRNRKNEMDYFAGQRAGEDAACAAQGLPAVSAVDATPVSSFSAEAE
jgi:MFS family permease